MKSKCGQKRLWAFLACLLLFITCFTGCSKKEKVKRIPDKEGVSECTWFADSKIEKSYRLDKISFSGDDKIAMLSYVTKAAGAPLDEYYTAYSSVQGEDGYGELQKVKFEDEFYPMWSYISYSGDKVIFTGIPAKQATDIAGFENGCNLYIGDFKDNRVTNIKKVDDGETKKRYYILSLLEDGSILYNVYDAKEDIFQLKYLKCTDGENYEATEIHHDKLDGYYCIYAYVNGREAFLWRADEKTHSFDALKGIFEDGNFREVEEISADFMEGKSYAGFYSAVGYDRTGGIYFYERDMQSSTLKLQRSQWNAEKR